MSEGPFRALHFEGDAIEDAHGLSVGSNWDVVRLPAFDDSACSPIWERVAAAPRVRRAPKAKPPAGPLFDGGPS